MNTFSTDQVEAWIDRNFFIGSIPAARTAMEDAASLVPEQASREQATRLLEKHPKGVQVPNTSYLGKAFIEMANAELVKVELLENGTMLEVTQL